MLSTYTALVFSSINLAISSGLSPSTNLVWIPRRGKNTLNWLYVPPYKFEVETMLSPACARVLMAMNWAAWPEEAASPATPPSRAAMRFSKTSTVGWKAR
jgi:hypothetical protein